VKLVEYPDTDMMLLDLADTLASELRAVLDHQDRALVVVPGGTTPGPIFDTLSAVDLDWARVLICLSDERWVPENHERSNTALVRERLLKGHAASASLVPLYQDATTPEDAAPVLAEAIDADLPIDICLLGMGADMHTASLFPRTPGLDAALAADAPVLCVMRPDSQPEARVTLSARVLRNAGSLHIVITGAEKRAALDRALTLPAEDAPVSALLDHAIVHWADH
jgi:6-phosphogluconolactonase